VIDRRTALAGVAGMFGAQLFAPIARAAGFIPAVIPAINQGPPTPVFNPAQRALATALSERVIPTTDTPGAIAAGVPEYIEHMLSDWAVGDDRTPVLRGLDAIEARSQRDYKVSAAKATPAQQDALLTLAMNDQFPGGKEFFQSFRQLVIVGYYTSEIGMTQEREYLPVPGEYDGAYLYSNINKVFSA
jgi:gluconate 2-dehydrogenase gamma chain